MARYFFDLPNDRDDCGAEFADVAALRRYALQYASELMRSSSVDTHGKDYWRVDVRNETGSIVFYVASELTPVQPDVYHWLRDTVPVGVQPGPDESEVRYRSASRGS